jgi:O-antigen ligase
LALFRESRPGSPGGGVRTRTQAATGYRRSLPELLLSPWFYLPLAVILGAFIAYELVNPTPRYIKLFFGLLFFGAVISMRLTTALILFVVVFPAPTFTYLGDTNVIFLCLLAILWAIQVRLGRMPRPVRTPIDRAILLYLAAHLLSFINVSTDRALAEGLKSALFLAAGVLLYVLLVNAIKTESQLHSLLKALCVTALFVYVTALYEFFTHGKMLIPAWFLYRAGQSDPTGVRIGGVFGSHGLLADFSAIVFYLQVFLAQRTRSILAKIGYYTLAALSVCMLALTVNRGGAVSWIIGGLLILLFMRHQVNRRKVALGILGLVLLTLSVQFYTGRNITHLGIVARLMGSEFVRGIPETRVLAWTNIMAKIKEHPLIGHGPFYDLGGGQEFGRLWPHSAFLWYLYTIGIVGMSTWAWMVGKLIWKSSLGWRSSVGSWTFSRYALVLAHVQIIQFTLGQVRSDHQRGNVYLHFMWILFAIATISYRLFVDQVETARSEGAVRDAGTRGASRPTSRRPSD